MADSKTPNPYPSRMKITEDVHIVCDSPNVMQWCGIPYGSEKWLKEKTERLEDWIRDFNAFMRDHRSQDTIHLSVHRDTKEICSLCKYDWETDDIGCPVCCDAAQEAFFVANPEKRPASEGAAQ